MGKQNLNIPTLAAARKYTDGSIAGYTGILAGKNCKIQSITPTANNSNIITFAWTKDDGTQKTTDLEVMNGVGITNITLDPTTDHLKITLSDGTIKDCGKGIYTVSARNTTTVDPDKPAKVTSTIDNTNKNVYLDFEIPRGEKAQYDTMPTPDATQVGKVIQYIGIDTQDYTSNYFYKCVEDTSTTPSTYSWVNVQVQKGGGGTADDHWVGETSVWENLPQSEKDKYEYVFFTDDVASGFMVVSDTVQEDDMNPVTSNAVYKAIKSGGGGSASLTDALNVSKAVGGIAVGTNYPTGTDLEDILRDMLDPVSYPTLTNPSASISATGTKLLETGATLNTTITITFNRGSISPAYGTSGYRAGTATGYVLNGGTSQATNTFSETVSESNKTFVGTVSYGVGEQPKDSTGADYSTPLPTGSVNTSTLTYEFVDAIWANTSTATSIDKQSLVSKSTKVKEFNFPATTDVDPEVFDIPASWTVTAVEALNTLSGQWEDVLGQFAVTATTHDNAASVAVNYNRYTCNLGFDLGARKVRCKWN